MRARYMFANRIERCFSHSKVQLSVLCLQLQLTHYVTLLVGSLNFTITVRKARLISGLTLPFLSNFPRKAPTK